MTSVLYNPNKSWNKSGTNLASGGLDCEIIIWDIVEECGLFRPKGIIYI